MKTGTVLLVAGAALLLYGLGSSNNNGAGNDPTNTDGNNNSVPEDGIYDPGDGGLVVVDNGESIYFTPQEISDWQQESAANFAALNFGFTNQQLDQFGNWFQGGGFTGTGVHGYSYTI